MLRRPHSRRSKVKRPKPRLNRLQPLIKIPLRPTRPIPKLRFLHEPRPSPSHTPHTTHPSPAQPQPTPPPTPHSQPAKREARQSTLAPTTPAAVRQSGDPAASPSQPPRLLPTKILRPTQPSHLPRPRPRTPRTNIRGLAQGRGYLWQRHHLLQDRLPNTNLINIPTPNPHNPALKLPTQPAISPIMLAPPVRRQEPISIQDLKPVPKSQSQSQTSPNLPVQQP